jgi:predicted metal-dependent hydrolase
MITKQKLNLKNYSGGKGNAKSLFQRYISFVRATVHPEDHRKHILVKW